MRIVIAFLFFSVQSISYSQVVATFENYNLQPGQYINNASPAQGFESGSVFLPNDYNTKFDVWSGYAISADTNTTTPGFTNQYSSIVGRGALGSTHYTIGYVFDPEFIYPTGKAIGKPMIGFYVTNSTYAYLSMLDGDAFAKKFGGETGNDPDFFMLTIKKYQGGAISDDSIDVYLADFRFGKPSQDYILKDWKYVDLTSLGEVDSLVMQLSSSDVGIFGMNTPAYVCIDEISTDNLLSASSIQTSGIQFNIGPNPATDMIHFMVPQKGSYEIFNLQGSQIWSQSLEVGMHEIRLEDFPSGLYLITFNGQIAGKFSVR
ncbi:MAG: DUF4465 domain-containing protein [Bacteroidota bacterium]|nr:DUF4465 domain-containing protein [Bacteroidota bacterium]